MLVKLFEQCSKFGVPSFLRSSKFDFGGQTQGLGSLKFGFEGPSENQLFVYLPAMVGVLIGATGL